MYASLPRWLQELAPILLLLAAVSVVVSRLPRVDLGHSPAYRRRRAMNWLPAGLTYAFLYMGRYNLNACKNALGEAMPKEAFGTIFFWGTLTYGVSFLVNGPLTDRFGGRAALLTAALGSLVMNVGMGSVLALGLTKGLVVTYSVLYAANMYFQSFGAVAIVKLNAPWFHVKERGTFGGVFGILIALGIYFAYDWGRLIVEALPVPYVFFIPAALLLVLAIWDGFAVRDLPSQAGFTDFETGDASLGDADGTGETPSVLEVTKRMLASPAIVTIAAVEFCSGYLRNGILQWYPIFAKDVGQGGSFVPNHWGMLNCVAGILGGVVAGLLSDRVFGARRGPVTAILYGAMVAGSLAMTMLLASAGVGWLMVLMGLAIIGVHGMLSGTASMDFGGKKNAGLAVGIIDGLVYLGTALEALVLGWVLPRGVSAKIASEWSAWPLALLPVAVVGFLLALRLWNARPKVASQSPGVQEKGNDVQTA